MKDRGTCKIDNTCTGKKSCEVYQKLKKRFTIEETTKDACILYGACPHFNPIKWIEGPEDALEELLRMPSVMIDHPGARKLGALRFGIEATKRMIPKAVEIKRTSSETDGGCVRVADSNRKPRRNIPILSVVRSEAKGGRR